MTNPEQSKAVISFGSILVKADSDRIWLEQDSGEAMEVSEIEMEKLLQDYYAGNF